MYVFYIAAFLNLSDSYLLLINSPGNRIVGRILAPDEMLVHEVATEADNLSVIPEVSIV